jgi:hypothetical protein
VQDRVAARRCDVVTDEVAPDLFDRMGGAAIKFDDEPEVAIQNVVVDVSASALVPHLPSATWQAMSPLDEPQVVQLERRLDTASHIVEGRGQLLAPARLLPISEICGQTSRSGQSPSARPGAPADRLVRRGCQVGEIQNRVLDSGARRAAQWLSHLGEAGGPMNDGTWEDLPHPAIGRDGHVDDVGGMIHQALYFGGGMMAQSRPIASRENDRPERHRTRDLAAEGREHSSVQPLPLTAFDSKLDLVVRHARSYCLAPTNDPGLV